MVATALPEVSAYEGRGLDVVRATESHVAFVEAVQQFLVTPVDRAQISESMKLETWQAKVNEMIRVMNLSPKEKDA